MAPQDINYITDDYGGADLEWEEDSGFETVTIGVEPDEVIDGALSVFFSNDEIIHIIPTGEVDYVTPEQAMFELLKEVSSMKLEQCGLKVIVTSR